MRIVLVVALVVVAMVIPASPAMAQTTWYVATTGSDTTGDGSSGNPWATIQHAVDDGGVADGDTIRVAAGIYNENVTIGKSLTLRGANAGVSAGSNPGSRGAESVVSGQITIQVNNVVVDGFQINSAGSSGIYVNGGTSGHTFSNNIFNGPGAGVSARGIEFGGNTNGVAVGDSEFTNWASGIYINPSSNILVDGNDFHGNTAGIGSDGINNVTVRYNDFTNNLEGWGYSDGGSVGGSNLEAHYNNFVNNTTAIANWTRLDATPDLIDATSNWWGDPTGPLDDSPIGQYNPDGLGDPVTDWVTYDPFWTQESGSGGGGCFIATAAYGSYLDSHVQTLRAFRDSRMETSAVGSALVSAYYKVSPPIARFIDDHPALKPAVRAGLLPAVGLSTATVELNLAAKAAIAGSMLLVSALAIVWVRRRPLSQRP